MSFPESLTTRIVKGRFVTYPFGTSAEGTVRIALNNYMQGPSQEAFLAPFGIEIQLVDGAFSIELPANDDPQWTPSFYTVLITINGKELRRKFLVPSSGSGALDLNSLITVPVVSASAGASFLLASTKASPGGVASLGSDGKVPLSQLPELTATDVEWTSVLGKPTVFPHAPIDWVDLQGKPSTFPHAPILWSEIEDKPELSTSTGPVVRFEYLDTGSIDVASHGSWTVLSGFSIPVSAVVGDRVSVSLTGLIDRGSTGNYFELVILVDGAIVTYGSTGKAFPATANEGDPGLYGEVRFYGFTAWEFGVIASSDILDDGNVVFGIAHHGGGGAKVYAEPNYPLRSVIRNDGSN